jgi:hypothetical protein
MVVSGRLVFLVVTSTNAQPKRLLLGEASFRDVQVLRGGMAC